RLRVLLVRHGETNENVRKVIQGQMDTELNAKGRLQADVAGLALKGVKLDRAFSSPLKRCRETSERILVHHPELLSEEGPNLELDDRLKERAFGELEGKVYQGPKEKPPGTVGMEKVEELELRLASFWNDLISYPTRVEVQGFRRRFRTRNILVVSHGAAISALVNGILLGSHYVSLAEGVQHSRFGNCSVTEILVPEVRYDARKLSDPTTSSPGDLCRKHEWTVRPSSMGIQGSLWLQDLEMRKAKLRSREEKEPVKEGGDQDSIRNSLERERRQIENLNRKYVEDKKRYERMSKDLLTGPDGQPVADVGYGQGRGRIVRFGDLSHLDVLSLDQTLSAANQGNSQSVNVDELV
ncbi:phosphoglycerate mutase-like protein, partial [Violaceomyces palustris]